MSINAVICVLSYTHQHFHIKVAPPGSAVSITSTEILSLFYLCFDYPAYDSTLIDLVYGCNSKLFLSIWQLKSQLFLSEVCREPRAKKETAFMTSLKNEHRCSSIHAGCEKGNCLLKHSKHEWWIYSLFLLIAPNGKYISKYTNVKINTAWMS